MGNVALGLPMATVNSTEGAAYGAALLGGVGAEWSKAYEDLYPRYRELYGALKPTQDALGA